jgi:phage gp36-like protein
MAYAALTDLETRYPGELTQAGPKDPTGALDTIAVGLALTAADDPIDRALRTIGWAVPLAVPAPNWVIDLAVDIALYLATPTVLASQEDFKDRRKRYETALETLMSIASGRLIPAPLLTGAVGSGVFVRSRERLFGRGIL